MRARGGRKVNKMYHCSAYHTASNLSERGLRVVTTYLRVLCHKNHCTWFNALPLVDCIMNRTPNPSTKIPSHELMTGEKPPPLFHGIPPNIAPLGQKELDMRLMAFKRLRDKAQKHRSRVRRHKNKWNPPVGDLVLVKNHKLSSRLKERYCRI